MEFVHCFLFAYNPTLWIDGQYGVNSKGQLVMHECLDLYTQRV